MSEPSVGGQGPPQDPPQGPPQGSPPGGVVFLSKDLIFSSRVKGAAERSDLAFHCGGRLPDTDAEAIRFVILDLSTQSELSAELMARCSDHCPQATVIAYAPHVQTGKIAAAREAGIPVVMTRGQFDSKLSTLFDQGSRRKSPS